MASMEVLVATSVIEVGIDIPNATVMVIQDANRFGLAQLHQFRGRVGRGAEQIVLLSAGRRGRPDRPRSGLQAITRTDDGFALAEEDLRLRGPGEFWGTRQSGLPELRVAHLSDTATIEQAREAAQDLFATDPLLELARARPAARPPARVLAHRERTQLTPRVTGAAARAQGQASISA